MKKDVIGFVLSILAASFTFICTIIGLVTFITYGYDDMILDAIFKTLTFISLIISLFIVDLVNRIKTKNLKVLPTSVMMFFACVIVFIFGTNVQPGIGYYGRSLININIIFNVFFWPALSFCFAGIFLWVTRLIKIVGQCETKNEGQETHAEIKKSEMATSEQMHKALFELKELLDKEVITKEEFDEKKKKFLNEI